MNNSCIPPPPARKKAFVLPVNQIVCGDNITVVSRWINNCIDGIVTDAPYELSFMGKKWDASGIAYNVPMWKQMLRICKPGAFLLCFGGTRTFHRLTCAIEDAGWEIRDCLMWLYGSGFPKSHNISKAIDKAAGVKRKIIGKRKGTYADIRRDKKTGIAELHGGIARDKPRIESIITAPATELAQLWNGYGTALKPAWEPIIVAMKPVDGTFAANAEKWKVAGLNIDGGRVGTEDNLNGGAYSISGNRQDLPGAIRSEKAAGMLASGKTTGKNFVQPQGRWPANLILDEEAGKMLDEQSGVSKSTGGKTKSKLGGDRVYGKYAGDKLGQNAGGLGDSGGASRFFYCAKASRKERNLGCGDQKNNHPTVKPLALIKYLCTLLKMPNQNQVILDPFIGSGTTAMACKELGINYIGIEKESEYCEIARKRIAVV